MPCFQRGHLCLVMRSLAPPSRALVDYHLDRDGMPLHDTVGLNCERGAATENQGAGAWYMG